MSKDNTSAIHIAVLLLLVACTIFSFYMFFSAGNAKSDLNGIFKKYLYGEEWGLMEWPKSKIEIEDACFSVYDRDDFKNMNSEQWQQICDYSMKNDIPPSSLRLLVKETGYLKKSKYFTATYDDFLDFIQVSMSKVRERQQEYSRLKQRASYTWFWIPALIFLFGTIIYLKVFLPSLYNKLLFIVFSLIVNSAKSKSKE